MAEEADKKSRRARRRAEKAQGAAGPPEDQAGADPEESSEAAATARDESAEDPADSVSEVRDRNRKVRARAAAKRRDRLEKERAVAVGLDTGEMVDDAFARSTHAATQWLKKNFRWVQWVIVAGIAGGIGYQIYSWRSGKVAAGATDELMQGVSAELGRVGPPPPDGTPAGPNFETASARSEAAAKAYDEARGKPGSGTAILATLGLANVLYDQGRYDEAIEKYQEVKGSALAANDGDVRGRVTEGIGLSLEAKKDVEGALAAFRELENLDVKGLSELGKYHQARVLFAKGEKDKAKALIGEVVEKTKPDKPRELGAPPGYLEQMARTLQQKIDPEAGKKGLSGLDLAAAAGGNVDEQTLKMLQEVIGEAGGGKDGLPAPMPSGAPAPSAAP